MPGFRIAHLSDPHLPPPDLPLGRLSAKQWLSMAAWRRKRHRHRPEILSKIAEDVAAAAPDHVVLTGDLTNFATEAEYQAAARWLGQFGDAGAVTVSPGNHDALTGSFGAGRFAPWAPWLGDTNELRFPMVRKRGPVAIVNLCSALPTALHKAQGRVGEDQAGRLADELRRAGEDGMFRVVLLHHPLTRGVVARRAELVDHASVGAILREAGAELVLHGHAHAASLASIEGPGSSIPVLGVPSASAAPGHGEAARWHMIEIDGPGAHAVQVVARGLQADGTVGELGRYALVTGQG